MKSNFASLFLIGALLVGGNALQAADTQSDWTTTLNVKLALLNKLGKDSLHIDVDASAGAVRLTGTVDKRETMELAGTIAKSVDGVKSTNNEIKFAATENSASKAGAATTEAEAEVKDAVLETKIRIAMIDKLGTDGFKIGTEAASGVVTLEFEPSLSAARRAEAIATVQAVGGVTKVVSVDKK